MIKWIIFTDLDGTLLDARTYSFAEAKNALRHLKLRKIPVIPCSSKTHLEVIKLRQKMHLEDPFIVENGSAIFFPWRYFPLNGIATTRFDSYEAVVLGKDYNEILDFLQYAKAKHHLAISGFHEMDIVDIQKHTDLPAIQAKLAQKRFFSEPFVVNDRKELPLSFIEEIHQNGFRLLRGNRFYHLLGNSDKGKAVKYVIQLFSTTRETNNLSTMGIGDSLNDLEMLKAVDIPVLVKKHTGLHQSGIELVNLILTKGIGPKGWQEVILDNIK